jgi:GNAT superfamily N-acetyltransferase
MPSVVIRPARPLDAAEILAMIVELAVFENEPPSRVKMTEADLRRDAFGERPIIEALIAEVDGRIEGFAIFLPSYSTWEGRAGVYIEDLYVRERARGRHLGRRLVAALAAVAVERDWRRIDLRVLDWNPARGFYERLGFQHIHVWEPYRLTEDAIRALALEA